jgi:MFS family permease
VIRSARTILVILTGLNLLNYLDRQVLSAVLGSIQDELHLSGSLGGTLGLVFLAGYFATSPLFGAWADRVGAGGRQQLIALGIAVWSAATVATGLVHGTAALVVTRAFVGVGEASYATIAPTLIDDFVPTTRPTRKGRWMAIFYAAVPVGSALGYIVGGLVLQATHSWRAAFFVAGGPGLVLALLCLLIAEPGRHVRTGGRSRPPVLGVARDLAAIPLYRVAVLGYCAYTFALGGFAFWAPTYLHRTYGVEQGHASYVFGLVTVAGGAIGTLAGGWMGDRLARGAKDDSELARKNLLVCVLSAGLGAPLAAAAVAATTAKAFYIAVFPCEVALFLSSGPVNLAVLRSVPAGVRASAMALSIFAIHALGDFWSPLLIGAVADHAPMQWAMFTGPFAFALAALIWWRGRPRTPSALHPAG